MTDAKIHVPQVMTVERTRGVLQVSRVGGIFGLVCFVSRQFHHEIGTWKAILLGGPGAQVSQLAAFGAERSPGVSLPGGRLTAERTMHGAILSCWPASGSTETRSAWADRITGFGVQQAVQAILIQFRHAEKFDAEFPMFAPTDGGRLDSDR